LRCRPCWSPGLSGGDHHPKWSIEVAALITKLLSAKPPCSYNAVASELLRRLNFKTDRASVRRSAIENHLAPDTRFKVPPKPVKRWQARDYGALWQYDASPHAWLPDCSDKQVLLDILDDATRLNTGARLYHAESLLAHFDFLSRIFQSHGLPLALYVGYHSFFYTHNPDVFTQLGQALHFYGVKLRHRELGQMPQAAYRQALAEKRSVIRPAPQCSWWPYVWSQQTRVRVGDDGKVPAGSQRHAIDAPPRSYVIRCLRPDGDIFFLRHAPNQISKPLLLLHVPVF